MKIYSHDSGRISSLYLELKESLRKIREKFDVQGGFLVISDRNSCETGSSSREKGKSQDYQSL